MLQTVAQTGQGVPEVVAALDQHLAWLRETGTLTARRSARARAEIEAIAVATLRARWGDVGGHAELQSLADDVAAGTTDPYTAADRLLDHD